VLALNCKVFQGTTSTDEGLISTLYSSGKGILVVVVDDLAVVVEVED
jgi:hypothetical protein